MFRRSAVTMLLVALCVDAAYGTGPSVERGRELFAPATQGKPGKGCAGCHPAGKGLKEAASYTDGTLIASINVCIRKALRSQVLDAGSDDMISLIMYIRTFATAPRATSPDRS